MRRIGSGSRFCWSSFSLTGEKIQACRQNSDLQAAHSQELCDILKREKSRLYRNHFSGLLFATLWTVDGLTTDIKLQCQTFFIPLEVGQKWRCPDRRWPQVFPHFPPGSFNLLFLHSETCSYGNLTHYVPISLHLCEIRWQESSYVALQQDNSINTCYNTHFPAGIWKHFCSLEAAGITPESVTRLSLWVFKEHFMCSSIR